jgi:hypothetical protein
MSILRLLVALAAHGFYRWAQHEIQPTHPDVERVLHRELYWRERVAACWLALGVTPETEPLHPHDRIVLAGCALSVPVIAAAMLGFI